ncbi:DUF1206 domain-containing protein [Synoicihabitans lomoniglobus]|uniref:DUF1206 domain-containing protein n=1 Tax=Synoicihabitans lomoniglobus TaxID=2909285 RepID=A0AAE9ZZX0_9BACT|nr:DUF1206 domain-containing protein [Opitutaceae bacterium LMO-M01]WED64588.1 DUF1206 domain-containing protein [Opitutaceae bacterium LMO-M01]
MENIKPWISIIARIGFGAKGTVHALVGLLAMTLAIGYTTKAEDMRGTLEEVSQQAFGSILLVILAIGLLSFGLWKAVQSAWDPEQISTDWMGWGVRALAGLSALLHFTIAWKTLSLGLGWGGGGQDGDEAVQSWTQQLLTMPAGRWLVIFAATIVAGVAVSQVVRLIRGRFMDMFEDNEKEMGKNQLVKTAARAGFVARTIVVILVAWFLWRAGVTADAEKAGGMAKALATLLEQPFGPWLVGATALGLFAEGVYIWLMVPYREIKIRRDTTEFRKTWRRVIND